MSISRRSPARTITMLGIFGGSFNPIHLAHLRSAEEVCEALRLDRVLFVPAASPPHKVHRALAPAHHRLAMVRRAIAGNPHFRASAIEIERGGSSYSVDTVRDLRARYPHARLFLIIGMDQYRELATWKAYSVLLTLCNVVVTSRPGLSSRHPQRSLPVAVRKDFCYMADRDCFVHREGTEIVFLPISDLDISASAIRARVSRGSSIRYLVPPSVHRYIVQHQLYSGRLNTLADC